MIIYIDNAHGVQKYLSLCSYIKLKKSRYTGLKLILSELYFEESIFIHIQLEHFQECICVYLSTDLLQISKRLHFLKYKTEKGKNKWCCLLVLLTSPDGFDVTGLDGLLRDNRLLFVVTHFVALDKTSRVQFNKSYTSEYNLITASYRSSFFNLSTTSSRSLAQH